MVILGLGSNIGDRLSQLKAAVAQCAPWLSGLRASRIYESAALLPGGAPDTWNLPFYNMAIAGESALSPGEIFTEIKRIEQALGRHKTAHWAPREIDIDILACGDKVVSSEALSVPHKELLNRDFALLPLCDIAPGWVYPGEGIYHGRTATDIAASKAYGIHPGLRDSGVSLHD